MTLLQLALKILQVVLDILGVTNTILGALNALGIKVGDPAQADDVHLVLTDTATIIAMLSDPTFGLAKIDEDGNTNTATILTAIAGVQQAGDPVILPTLPPTGYGGDPSAVATAVWTYPSPDGDQPAIQLLEDAGFLAINMATAGVAFPLGNNSMLNIQGNWWTVFGPSSFNNQPIASETSILSDDTLLTWLNRDSGFDGWTLNDSGYAICTDPNDGFEFGWITRLSETEFEQFRDSLFALPPVPQAPVWPGLANVVLGTPVALSADFTITEDMNGVLVEVTSVPGSTSFFNFDGNLSYRYLGALAFVDDNGDFELPQNLGFQLGVYCVRSMVLASGVSVRVKPGVTGTITPWTLA